LSESRCNGHFFEKDALQPPFKCPWGSISVLDHRPKSDSKENTCLTDQILSLSFFLSHTLSLSLSFIHAKTSAKLWSFQVKLLSVRLYILKSLSSPNASNTAFLPHYFCTSLIYMIKIKKNIQMGESHETCHKHIPVTFHSNQMKKKTWNSILQVNLKSVLRTIFFNAPKNRPHNFSRDFGGKMWHEIDSNPYLIFTTIEILVLYSCCIGYSCLSYIFNWKK